MCLAVVLWAEFVFLTRHSSHSTLILSIVATSRHVRQGDLRASGAKQLPSWSARRTAKQTSPYPRVASGTGALSAKHRPLSYVHVGFSLHLFYLPLFGFLAEYKSARACAQFYSCLHSISGH